MDCVEAALQTLIKHVAEYKAIKYKQQCDLEELKEENLKLLQMVKFLQKQIKITPIQFDESYMENDSASTSLHNVDMKTPSKLDTASWDCEDHLPATSPVNISPRSSVDVIAETEMLTHNSRGKRLARQKTHPQYPLKDVNGKDKRNNESRKKQSNPERQTLNAERSHKKQISLSLRKKGLNRNQTELPSEANQQENSCLKKTQSMRVQKTPAKSALSWILSGNRNDESSHFDASAHVNNEDHKENSNETLLIPSSTTDTIVFVSPTTPEIIFLDESCNSLSTPILNEAQSNKPNSLIESQSKRQLIPKTTNSPIMNLNNEHLLPVGNKRIKIENDFKKEEFHIVEAIEEMGSDFSQDESEDSFNVRPIMVKEEPKTPKQSIKERFKLNCPDCEEFFGTNNESLNDDAILMHLKGCKHYKHTHDERQTQTPEGFWNPLIVPFDQYDRRNEVLVDNRFKKH